MKFYHRRIKNVDKMHARKCKRNVHNLMSKNKIYMGTT